MPHRRFTDPEVRKNIAADFVQRSYGVSMIWVVLAFTLGYIVMVGVLQYLALKGDLAYHPEDAVFTLSIVGGVIFAMLASMSVMFVNRNRDLIMATEFQNLLFASSARIDTEFCLIVKVGGIVVYADPHFNDYFPFESAGSTIDEFQRLLESGGVRDDQRQAVLDAVTRGDPITVPFSLRGSGRVLSLHVRPISRPKGYIIIRGVADDSKATLFDSLDMGVYALGDGGKLSYFNEAFANMLGYSKMNRDQLHAVSLADLVMHDIPEDASEIIGNVILQTRTKEEKPVVISDIGGGYYLVTDLVSAHETVDMFTGDFWDFLENSPIPKVMLDENGSVTKINRAFTEFFGDYVPPGEGWHFYKMIQPDFREEVEQHFRRVVRGESIDDHKMKPIEIQLDKNHEHTSLMYCSRMIDRHRNMLGVVVHLIDTTEQKKLEQRFVHSQKMQAVGQLAGGIAHDFNNLLTAMMGFCDLLLMRHPAGDPSFADIMQIKQNLNRATNLVRQLLAFSRKQTLQPKVLDMTSVLEELLQLIRRLIGENINLEIHHGRHLNLVKVDQGQLEQVIINLAVNARDAMEGGGTLTISTENVVLTSFSDVGKSFCPAVEGDIIEAGDYVRIDVTDTGSGIVPEILSQIFEPFFSTKEITSGTGLGLSTVYGIVRQTGGYIYVKTKIDKGTTFSIFFKTHTMNEQDEEVKKRSSDMAEQVSFKDLTGEGTVLLVEDEDPVRLFSSHALTNKGYHVLEADSGEAALQVVEKEGDSIDIIITDVVMPGMNGPTMVEKVQATYPDIKVIYISGYAEDAFVKSYGTERKFHFLAKPFSLKQLAGKVKEVLQGDDA